MADDKPYKNLDEIAVDHSRAFKQLIDREIPIREGKAISNAFGKQISFHKLKAYTKRHGIDPEILNY